MVVFYAGDGVAYAVLILSLLSCREAAGRWA
jgi:hypothetical protein